MNDTVKVGAGGTAIRVLGAEHVAELEQVRQFFRNYAAWLGVDLSFQNFDEEMASLPGRYSAPEGRLFYATVDGRGAGCVGIRLLSEGVCELKRLYVDPAFRGLGVGRDLALEAIRVARRIGYRKILLDTLPAMRIAVKLYRELGFDEAPAYYQTPVEGTQFLALDLENWSEDALNNRTLHHLFDFNRAWSNKMREVDPGYFEKLSHLQTPELLDPIVIVSAARTPMGGFQGDFASLACAQLGAAAIRAAVERAGLKPEQVEEAIMGCVLPAGQGQAPARQAALGAGLPLGTGCTTVNKMCGSGMRAAMFAHDMLAAGTNDILVAGGMESMSNAPYLLPKARAGMRLGHGQVYDHMFLDGLEDAYQKGRLMGTFAEECAEKYGFTRQAQDDFAIARRRARSRPSTTAPSPGRSRR
jgi:GNAT superfamily N-acetyltransferase